MLIAIMSDSHDNIWNLKKALKILKYNRAEMILHCGDFIAPFMLKELNNAGIPVHGVFGNNDGDQYLLTKLSCTELKNITLHGMIAKLDTDGFRIAFTHFDDIAFGLAGSGDYDLVCFGHSHQFLERMIDKTILLNPGEIMGKDRHAGFCLFDTATREIQWIELD